MKPKKHKCNPVENLPPCRLPEIDLKHHRKMIRKYLKGFNKAIEKAIKDDRLVKRIELTDDIEPYLLDGIICTHTISFTDHNHIKF